MSDKRGVGLCHNEELLHYLDHVGVMCTIMDMPIIVLQDLNEELAKKYYPDLKVIALPYGDLTPEYLYKNYDVLYLSEYWTNDTLRSKFPKSINLQVVHCPHGFSDKSYYLLYCAYEDILLVYGQHMLDMFKRLNLLHELKSYIITGNYRYTYYKKHKAFYDNIMKTEILNQFEKEQPIVLYAPTWEDSRLASTFYEACGPLIDSLPSSYNMIVKVHPAMLRDKIAEYYMMVNTYADRKNVLFICEFPPIYPLLEASSLYIGDTSSIGYDYLVFDRPMFFLNKYNLDAANNPELYLYRCGRVLTPDQYSSIYSIIEKELPRDKSTYSEIRKEVYKYTFGEERAFEQIKQDVLQIIL